MRVQGAASPNGPTNHAPVIANVTLTPAAPADADPVWVTAYITDDVSVAQATLLYRTGASASQTNTAFLETMRTTSVKPWIGDGCDNPWTIAFTSTSPFEQRIGSNYGGGNTNGMEFKQGTANLGDSMITATQTIDARGTAGFVEFWIWAAGLSGTAGWTFQLNAGSGYATRLSELTGTSHSWQVYHYDLQSAELTSNLSLRFQFAGGVAENRIDLDYISVKTLVAGATGTSVPMYDDGMHQDGAAGDGVYGAQVPAQAAGTAVSYYLSASDSAGAATVEPTGAPSLAYSYTVSSVVTSVAHTVGMFLNTSNAFDGYTLMAPMHFTNTYLINNAGQVVHQWASAYEPGRSAYLLENGHMIRAGMVTSGGPSTGGGEGGRIEEYDWDGTMVWAIDYYSANYIHHHDFKVLPSGKILLLVAEKKTYAEVVAAGFNTNLLDAQIISSGYMLPDCLVEITPTGTYGGIVVWEWHIWDHMIQDYDPTKNNFGVVADHPEWIDVNGTGIKIPQFWNHVNGIDHNPQLDQVIISVRGNSELFVIDHQVTTTQAAGHAGGRYNKGGDILYRWGNPQQYNRGTSANQILYQQHHTHWIETNRPGASNILIFNNGIGRNYSTINEIAPPVDVTGAYARTAAAAFGPPTNVWLYTASPPTNFYSAEISGCQRQPNGNTLICEGIKGNLFEVSAAGQMVWRYLCPVTTEPLHQGDAIPVDPARTDQFMNAVFRVYRYAPDFPGLAGRDLTPYGVIEIYQDAPAVDLTNAATTVDYGITTTAIGGLNNAYVAGTMTWTNRLTGACAAFPAATAWRIDDIGLALGDNIIVVAGTNAAGIPACDNVTITRLLPEPALMLGLVGALWALRRAA